MSQNDYVIANQTTPLFRADLNTALQALASNSSGATAPATTYANMLWYDTATNILKMRSEADDAWINLGTLDQSANTFTPAGVPELTQVQAEDDASTVFGQVSGQRLSQAVAANGLGGTEQTWQDVSGSRVKEVNYQNTTGIPIQVLIVFFASEDLRYRFYVSSDNISYLTIYDVEETIFDRVDRKSIAVIIPAGHYYRFSAEGGGTFMKWVELR